MELIIIVALYLLAGVMTSLALSGEIDASYVVFWPFVLIGLVALYLYERDEQKKIQENEEDDQWME